MHEVALPGELLEITVESAYQRSVYEQTAHVRLDDGTQINLFDGTSAIDEKQIGEHGNFVVLALPKVSPSIVDSTDPGIRPAENSSSKWGYEFCGEILTVGQENKWTNQSYESLLVIDVGIGRILLESNKEMRKEIANSRLCVGDFICVTASRADVIELVVG